MEIKIIVVYSIEADEPCHMIEMKIQRLGFDLDIGSFTQEIPGEAEDNWQVPYDEQFLNSEGTMILNPDYPHVPCSIKQGWKVACLPQSS